MPPEGEKAKLCWECGAGLDNDAVVVIISGCGCSIDPVAGCVNRDSKSSSFFSRVKALLEGGGVPDLEDTMVKNSEF